VLVFYMVEAMAVNTDYQVYICTRAKIHIAPMDVEATSSWKNDVSSLRNFSLFDDSCLPN